MLSFTDDTGGNKKNQNVPMTKETKIEGINKGDTKTDP
jgi:hypothetical protein